MRLEILRRSTFHLRDATRSPDGHHNLSSDELIYEVLFLSPILSLTLSSRDYTILKPRAEANKLLAATPVQEMWPRRERGAAHSSHSDNHHFSFIVLISDGRVNCATFQLRFDPWFILCLNQIAANHWRTQSSSFKLTHIGVFYGDFYVFIIVTLWAPVWRRCVSWMEPLSGKISGRRTTRSWSIIYLFACQNKYTLIFHCVHLTHARFTVWISVSLQVFRYCRTHAPRMCSWLAATPRSLFYF